LRRIRFSTSLADAVDECSVLMIAVGTPETPSGEADLSQIINVVTDLVVHLKQYRLIVTKSTVPVGTGAMIDRLLRAHLGPDGQFDVVSNPEFLREGSAVSDFMRPDRVVIGTTTERAAEIMRELYRPLYLIETPMLFTNIETAEMVKYASNAFLATKISFMNEIANLCDETCADVHAVAKGMGLDKRIGSKFLHPGPGFGGSCFPKDTRALAALGERQESPQLIVQAAIETNKRQFRYAVDKIVAAAGGVDGKTIAILGLAFKPNTSDVREAPAIFICRELIRAGARIQAYDPVAQGEAAEALGDVADRVEFASDADAAADGAHLLVIVTEWNEFRNLDLSRMKTLLRCPAIVDLRNVLDPERVHAEGFAYWCTGRQVTVARSSIKRFSETALSRSN
jgi:UDPglucose 6-dehydrogenase